MAVTYDTSTPDSLPLYIEESYTAIDANAATTTATVDLGRYRYVSVDVEAASGTSATHIITVQTSLDGTKWWDTSNTIAQAAQADFTHDGRYIRLKVTTLEGGASTVDARLQAK